MKNITTAAALLFSMTAFAQVGINNTSPKATLDITAKTTDGSKPEGLIIPQLTGDKIRIATTVTPTPVYGTAQKGLIVYASTADSAPAGATASITAPGYYYFDGSVWQKIATGNTLNTSLANGNIYVGSASNVATAVIPTGDVAISNAGITSIGAGKVTNGHMASAAALTVKGNATNAAASPTDIAAGTDGYVLRRSGTSLGFGTVATAGIADGAVTANKMTLSNGKIYVGNSSGAAAEVSLSGDATMDNTGAASILEGKGGIYKGNGALSKNTVVGQANYTLAFTSNATNGFSVDGTTFSVDALNNRVGIGTSSPGNLLEISSSSSNTGLKLPYGAAAGKILTSDASGNSSWQTNNAVFIYSEVHSTGGSTSFPAGSIVNFFHTIKGENIKTIYGNSYGWIDATQRWVAPYNGKYRITTNMYFNPGSSSNPRLYAFINGTTVCNITSATSDGLSDGTAYTSAIVSLNQGDYIQWKTQTSAVLYGLDYHTFIRVESVE